MTTESVLDKQTQDSTCHLKIDVSSQIRETRCRLPNKPYNLDSLHATDVLELKRSDELTGMAQIHNGFNAR